MRKRATLLMLAAALGAAPALAQEQAAAPVQVAGLWCGTGPLHEFSLQIAQDAGAVEGKLRRKQRERHITGRIEGRTVITDTYDKVGGLVLEAVGNELQVTGGSGPLVLLRGQVFARARGESCAAG